MIAPIQTPRSHKNIVPRRNALFALVIATAAACTSAFAPVAKSGTLNEPIDLDIIGRVVPGEPLVCNVSTTEGNGTVTIYSEPAGAVSYQGTVTSTTTTVTATTSPNIDAESVTVYVSTGGNQVVGTEVPVEGQQAVSLDLGR